MTQVATTEYFKHPVNDFYIVCRKEDFTKTALVRIDQLHPNQQFVDTDLVTKKAKDNKLHTTCYVIKHADKYVLVDGHHTIAAKSLKGTHKKVKVMLYIAA